MDSGVAAASIVATISVVALELRDALNVERRYCQMLCIAIDQAASFLMPSTN